MDFSDGDGDSDDGGVASMLLSMARGEVPDQSQAPDQILTQPDLKSDAKPNFGGDAEPNFGGGAEPEDNGTLLARAKAYLAAKRAQQPRAAEEKQPRADTPAVDLNDPAQLANLEDKGLLEHTAQARARLEAYTAARALLPSRQELDAQDNEARRGLSQTMMELQAHLMALRGHAEAAHLQAKNTARVAQGEVPFGYPPSGGAMSPAQGKSMAAIARQSERLGAGLEAVVEGLEETLKLITRARRACENAIDGNARWAQLNEGAGRT